MHGELDKVIDNIVQHLPFNEENYPELKGKSDREILLFAVRHNALHFAKTAGNIAAISEDVDHGETIEIEKLKIDIAKSFINTLRLAGLVEMHEDDLLSAIKEIMNKPHV